MSKVLVTGYFGMLGSAVKEVFNDDELLLTDMHNLDVRVYDQVMFYKSFKPDFIIHLAAITDLEYCEKNPTDTYMTNHTGTVNMMCLAESLDIPMVFISTAGVFDGEKDIFNDDSLPNPLNHYGRSKWFAEMSLVNYHKVWTFRASWMMGGGPEKDKKFVNMIYKQIKSGVKEIYAIDDVYGSPTYTVDLARTIQNVINHNYPFGTYNCAGEGRASRYDVAKAVVEFLKADVEVIAVKDGYFTEKFPCKRSKCEVLDNGMLNSFELSKMRPWRVALKEYIEKCYTL